VLSTHPAITHMFITTNLFERLGNSSGPLTDEAVGGPEELPGST
jgi:hypothetical protein